MHNWAEVTKALFNYTLFMDLIRRAGDVSYIRNESVNPPNTAPAAPSVRASAIDEEFNSQLNYVDKLHALLDTLCARLEPVLTPPVPTVDDKNNSITEASPYANRLATINGKLSSAIRKLSDILERCDL